MDLDTLKAALEPLTQFGQEELTFPVEMGGGEVMVTLRPLLPREEIAVQQYSAAVLAETKEEEGEENDALTRAAALQYMDMFRTEVIAYALVQVGNTDFRKTKYIDVPDGRIEKHAALRQVMSESWSRGMITICFAKYGDLMTSITEKADKIVKESVADLDAEIDRLERRLENIKSERDRRAKGDPSVTAQQIQSLVSAGNALEQELDQAVEQSRRDREEAEDITKAAADAVTEAATAEASTAPQPPPQSEPEPPAPRQSVIPKKVPPPTTGAVNPPQFRSSFEEDDHPDSHQVALDRLRAAQAAAAADSAQRLQENPGQSRAALAQALEEGTMRGPDGKPLIGPDGEEVRAYRLPSETISDRGRTKTTPGGKPKVNQGGGGSINPHFKKPGG